MQQNLNDFMQQFKKKVDEKDLPPLVEELSFLQKEQQILKEDNRTFLNFTLFIHCYDFDIDGVFCIFIKTDNSVRELKQLIQQKCEIVLPESQKWLIKHENQVCFDEEQKITYYQIFNNSHLYVIQKDEKLLEMKEEQYLKVEVQNGSCIINFNTSYRFYDTLDDLKRSISLYLGSLIFEVHLQIDSQIIQQKNDKTCQKKTLLYYKIYPSTAISAKVKWIGGGGDPNYFFIKFKDQMFNVQVEKESRIFEIKEALEAAIDIPIAQQELKFCGLSLRNQMPRSYYNFYGGDTLELIQQPYDFEKDKTNLKIIFYEKENHIQALLGEQLDSVIDLTSKINSDGLFLHNGSICNKDLIDDKLNKNQIIFIDEEEGVACLKFSQEIQNQDVSDLIALQKSLEWINNLDQVKEFLDIIIQEVKNTKNILIYQQLSLVHIIAIKLWTSNLIYKQCNIDLRARKYKQWQGYLNCLLNALRNCKYFRGNSFRGIRNYQDLMVYQQGKFIQWSEITCISKKEKIAKMFCNEKGTMFEIELISAKDISQISISANEEEVIMLPFSTYQVTEVISQTTPIIVKLKEFPLPRQTNIILWVDDNPENNYNYAIELEKERPDISVIFCTSTEDAMIAIKRYKWIVLLKSSHFRVVSDMKRLENGQNNYKAGIDLLDFLYKNYNYKNEVLIFCGDVQKAKVNCKRLMIQVNYRITNKPNELKQFIRFS